MFVKRLAFCLLFSAFYSFAFAQKVKIEGVITDEENDPLEVANVVALRKADNSIESFGITNADGKYQFQVNANQEYVLKVSYIGLEPVEKPLVVGTENLTINIQMAASSIDLDAIEIVHEMPG